MARTVAEIMNRELASVRPSDSHDAVRDSILAMGITAMPVLDEDRHPIGLYSLRDVVDPLREAEPARRPVATVLPETSVDQAARMLAETDYHHLVVVDHRGHAVGMVSAVDLLRGLVGAPARHPAAFPHLDAELGVAWSDDAVLTRERIVDAQESPGVLVLVHGGRNVEEIVVWAESCTNLRMRLEELLAIPQDTPRLRVLLEHQLRFRVAAVPDARRRDAITERIRARIHHLPLPQAAVR